MGVKGDLLELIDRAPAGLRTFEGSLWTWRHHERTRQAFEEMARRRGATVGHLVVGKGPVEQSSDTHEQVIVELPNRWRIEGPDRIELCDGANRWTGLADRITHLSGDSCDLDSTEFGPLIHPGSFLFGSLRFGQPTSEEVAGRRCWRTNALPSEVRDLRGHLMMRLGGVEHSFWFDTETGVVLRHVGMFDGQPCTIHEFSEVFFDRSLPVEAFRFTPPPGATVETQADQLARIAEHQGVDLSRVDRSDPTALHAAIAQSRGMAPTARRTAARRSKHVPVGPPPDDAAEARSRIEYAFAHLDEVAGDGNALVNVQSGEGMAPLLERARRRLPNSDPAAVHIVVDDVLFLRTDEAVVWFGIEVDGERSPIVNGREARALLIDGRWVVERASLGDLLAFAGVPYPGDPR